MEFGLRPALMQVRWRRDGGAAVGIPASAASPFFIIVTLAVGVILYTCSTIDALTGGPKVPGIHGAAIGRGIAVIDFRGQGFYWLALTVFAAMFLLQYIIVRSDFGRSLAAIARTRQCGGARRRCFRPQACNLWISAGSPASVAG